MFYNITHIFFIIFFVFFSPKVYVVYAQTDAPEENAEEVLPFVIEEDQVANTTDTFVDESQLGFFDTEATEGISISSVGIVDILRVIFVLVIIILIVYGIIWLLKKIQHRSLVNASSIEILSSQSLQQGNMLYVVKSGETYLLLGATSQSIVTIKEFSKKEEKDELLLSLSINASNDSNAKNNGKGTGFLVLLRNVFSRVAKNSQASDNKNKTRKGNSVAIENELHSLESKAKRGENLNAY